MSEKCLVDADRHGDILENSGISVEDAIAARLESVPEGLRIPYWSPRHGGFPGFARTRLDVPMADGGKYVQAKQSGSHLYFAPNINHDTYRELLENSRVPVFVVEGEKKALSLQSRVQDKAVVIGLGGVWNWCKKAAISGGPRPLIGDFDQVNLEGRQIYVIFDSDVGTNSQVREAERELARSLNNQGASATLLVSLSPLDGKRMGVDDWLVEWGPDWRSQLRDLCKRAATTRVEIPRIFGFEEMLNETFPPIKVLLGTEAFPILNSGGLCYIHSMSGVGKTYFSMQMAHALSTGQAFLGHPVSGRDRPLRVVFMQAELGAGWFQRRLASLEKTFGPAGELSLANGQVTLAYPAGYGRYEIDLLPLEQIIRDLGADVVFIDPLQGYLDIPENNTDANRQFQRALAILRHRYECAIVVTHHDRKSQEGESMHLMRGSSVLTDWADVVFSISRSYIEVEKHKILVPHELVLAYDKVRHAEGPRPDAITLRRVSVGGFGTPWLELPPPELSKECSFEPQLASSIELDDHASQMHLWTQSRRESEE